MVAAPVTARSRLRSVPPARLISKSVRWLRIEATPMWLVTMRRPSWSSSASATASMVVPISMNSEAPCGISRATSLAIARLATALRILRLE